MPTISVTWHSRKDSRVCPICKALDGYTWTFEAGKNLMLSVLVCSPYGVVWDANTGSMAHGHTSINCRCHLTISYDLEDVLAKCAYLREVVAQASQEATV